MKLAKLAQVALFASNDSFGNNLRHRYTEYEERAKPLFDTEHYKTFLLRKRKGNTRCDSAAGNSRTQGIVLTGAGKIRIETFSVIFYH